MEIYKQREHELNNAIDDLYSIAPIFENYKEEVNHFIDLLLKETVEFPSLKNRIYKLEKGIKNIIFQLEHNPRENAENRDKYIIEQLKLLLESEVN